MVRGFILMQVAGILLIAIVVMACSGVRQKNICETNARCDIRGTWRYPDDTVACMVIERDSIQELDDYAQRRRAYKVVGNHIIWFYWNFDPDTIKFAMRDQNTLVLFFAGGCMVYVRMR